MEKEKKDLNEYIAEVEKLLENLNTKAMEYYSAKTVTKAHYKDLMYYMIENKIQELGKIELKAYKGYPYLKIKGNVFDKLTKDFNDV